MIRQFRFILCLVLLWLVGCSTLPRTDAPTRTETTPRSPTAVEAQSSPTQRRLMNEAASLQPLAQSEFTRRFLAATSALPPVAPRTAYLNELTREYLSPAARAALPEARRIKFAEVQLDEYRYYYTKYGSPLAYMRALEFAADKALQEVAGKRIFDFGYGSIGHLRLLASLGANVTGVDTDSYLAALYTDSADQGPIAPAIGAGVSRRARGSVTLVRGSWPGDPKVAAQVGQGYDLILSKNTLKRGYVKPERKVEDKRQLIDLGVSDQVFLAAIFNALVPGGKLVIYNIFPKPATAKEKFKPLADGHSPFSREQYEKAGFKVVAFDAEDNVVVRKMGRLLKWDQNERGETTDNLDTNLFSLVTVVVRP